MKILVRMLISQAVLLDVWVCFYGQFLDLLREHGYWLSVHLTLENLSRDFFFYLSIHFKLNTYYIALQSVDVSSRKRIARERECLDSWLRGDGENIN